MFQFFGKPSFRTIWPSVSGAVFLCVAGGVSSVAVAQDGTYNPANYTWQANAIMSVELGVEFDPVARIFAAQ